MLLVYDGDCAFCTRCADLALRVAGGRYAVAPWQRLDLGRLGLTEAQCREAAWFVDDAAPEPGRRRERGHRAIVAALAHGRPGWRLVGRLAEALLRVPVVDRSLASSYAWVAEHRDVLPGGTAACRLDADTRQGTAAPTAAGNDQGTAAGIEASGTASERASGTASGTAATEAWVRP